MDYIEKYDKETMAKGAILFIVLQLSLNWGISFFKLFNHYYLIENINFFVYFALFILFILVYRKMIFTSVKSIKKNDFKWLAIYLFSTIFFMVLYAIIVDRFGIINANETENIEMNLIFTYLTVVIFGPIVEELTYRFFIFRGLEKINPYLAHLLTAFIFGFSHVGYYVIVKGDFTQIISMFTYCIISFGASLLYSKTKNLSYPILLHMIINFISLT